MSNETTYSAPMAKSTSPAKRVGLSAMYAHKGVSAHFIFGTGIFLVAFVLPTISELSVDLPALSLFVLTFLIFVIYIGVSIFMWRKLRIMTANRIYATLLTLVPWIPGMEFPFFLTHVSAIAPIGFSGAVTALIAPKEAVRSQCPRLRMPSGLASTVQHENSQRNKYRLAFLILAINASIMWFLSNFRVLGHNYLPGGILYVSHFGLVDFYPIAYLGIKLWHSTSGGKPVASNGETSEAVPLDEFRPHTVSATEPQTASGST
ncbi:hypothetical protein PENSPDRAFT_752055 [Peniophora sp. CONT]|nr:hypothetical protein PENSPDRAFT_752055 [Peniophora sp. CONT]